MIITSNDGMSSADDDPTVALIAGLEQRLLVDIKSLALLVGRRGRRSTVQREMDHIFQSLCLLLSAREQRLRERHDPELATRLNEHARLKQQVDAEMRAIVQLNEFPLVRVAHVFDPVVIFIAALSASKQPPAAIARADLPVVRPNKRTVKFMAWPKRNLIPVAVPQ